MCTHHDLWQWLYGVYNAGDNFGRLMRRSFRYRWFLKRVHETASKQFPLSPTDHDVSLHRFSKHHIEALIIVRTIGSSPATEDWSKSVFLYSGEMASPTSYQSPEEGAWRRDLKTRKGLRSDCKFFFQTEQVPWPNSSWQMTPWPIDLSRCIIFLPDSPPLLEASKDASFLKGESILASTWYFLTFEPSHQKEKAHSNLGILYPAPRNPFSALSHDIPNDHFLLW